MGCDALFDHLELLPPHISIHAPAWGATGMPSWRASHFVISIHAPAWGATMGVRSLFHPGLISIHAPAWGATTLS